MANAIITPTIIAREALMQVENNLVMGNNVHREYKKEFVKVGGTVNIRKPVKFVVSDGATRVHQDVEEANTSIVVDQRKHVSWGFATQDLTLSIEEFSERYIKPAAIVLANNVDAALCGLYKDVWNWVGTAGQTVNSYTDFAKAPERLDLQAVPRDARRAVMSPADHWGLLGNQTGLYMSKVAEGAYREGSLGRLGGVDTFMDQNVVSHTTGAVAVGTPLTDGAGQETTYALSKTTNTQTIVTDGWTASKVLAVGDVITIDTVFAVNPVSKATLSYLQPFVITAAVTANATTTADTTLTISPAIITSGPYQNVSVTTVPDGATISFTGTVATSYPQNLVFHKNAFALVTVPLEMPDGVSFKARESHKGLSIRVVKDYDIDNDEDVIRLDILYGVKSIYPDLATRLSGTA